MKINKMKKMKVIYFLSKWESRPMWMPKRNLDGLNEHLDGFFKNFLNI